MKTKSFIIPFLLFQALLFTGSNLLYAIPARPGVITVTQSDGTRHLWRRILPLHYI